MCAAEEGLEQVQLQGSGVVYNYNLARLQTGKCRILSVPVALLSAGGTGLM